MQRAFDRLRSEVDVVVVGGLSMGGDPRAAGWRPTAATRSRASPWSTRPSPRDGSTRRLCRCSSTWSRAGPAIGNDIKKPGGEEYPYPKTPLKALHTFVQQWKPLIADLPSITQPLLIFRSVEDHVVDSSSVPIITSRVSSRDVTERLLEDSYHVATLDNDAPSIFEESAAFVARVAADAPAH